MFEIERKDLNFSIIGLDTLKEIAVEIIDKFFECLEDVENNFLDSEEIITAFNIFKETNFGDNELDFPELDEIQLIKNLTLLEALEKSSSISSLLDSQIISLGEDLEKKFTPNCRNLEQIIDDLADFKQSVNDLEEELEEFQYSKEKTLNLLFQKSHQQYFKIIWKFKNRRISRKSLKILIRKIY